MTAEDQPAAERRYNEIRISAVLVPAGQHPGSDVYDRISNPVRLPVRIRRRETGSEAQTAGAAGQSQANSAMPQSAEPKSSDDPNMPAAPDGTRGMAPRRVRPRSGRGTPNS